MAGRTTSRVLTLLLLLCACALAALAYSNVRIVSLSYTDGRVLVQRPGTAAAVPAITNYPLENGAVVETPNSVAEIEFEDRTYVRLAERSRLRLTELGLEDNGDRVTRLALERGTATVRLRLHDGDFFLLRAGLLDITPSGKANFRVDLDDAGATLTVTRGDAVVTTPAETLTVLAGQRLDWRNDDARYLIARSPAPDDWDRWNDQRDQVLAAALNYTASAVTTHYGFYGSSAYLNPYLNPGNCGAWLYDPYLGRMVWSPDPFTSPFYNNLYGWYDPARAFNHGCSLNGSWWFPGDFVFLFPHHRRHHRPPSMQPDGEGNGGGGTAGRFSGGNTRGNGTSGRRISPSPAARNSLDGDTRTQPAVQPAPATRPAQVRPQPAPPHSTGARVGPRSTPPRSARSPASGQRGARAPRSSGSRSKHQ